MDYGWTKDFPNAFPRYPKRGKVRISGRAKRGKSGFSLGQSAGPSVTSFLKALCRSKGNSLSKVKHVSRHQYEIEQGSDEEEEGEDQLIRNKNEEGSMSANGVPAPTKSILTGQRPISTDSDANAHTSHSGGNTSIEKLEPVKSITIEHMTVVAKTQKEHPKSSQALTVRKNLSSDVTKEPPIKAAKWCTTEPISNMPAKKTRSKTAVVEAPKAKRGRK
ncbi:hypothetical protein C8R48DRAFT_674028 [Suillus tomentosus]|nr:hypothetical protein C8R48DRAFT_674028 [Suillus tomentosus]